MKFKNIIGLLIVLFVYNIVLKKIFKEYGYIIEVY